MNDQEKKYLREVILRAIADGCLVTVDDGEDNPIALSRDVEAVLTNLGHCEEEYLLLHNNIGRNHVGTIFIVYGNEPDEVISNYSWSTKHGEDRMKAIVGEYKA